MRLGDDDDDLLRGGGLRRQEYAAWAVDSKAISWSFVQERGGFICKSALAVQVRSYFFVDFVGILDIRCKTFLFCDESRSSIGVPPYSMLVEMLLYSKRLKNDLIVIRSYIFRNVLQVLLIL